MFPKTNQHYYDSNNVHRTQLIVLETVRYKMSSQGQSNVFDGVMNDYLNETFE